MGLVLYELLALERIGDQPYQLRLTSLPVLFRHIVEKAISKQREDRFQKTDEMAEALEKALAEMTPPPAFDSHWLARQSLESIKDHGTQSNAQWVKELYAWIYSRQKSNAARKDWPPPIPEPTPPRSGYFPVPLAASGKHTMGFLTVSFKDEGLFELADGATERSVQEAAVEAAKWCASNGRDFELSDPPALMPVVNLPSLEAGDGMALPAFIATLTGLMRIQVPDTVCAVGGWENGRFQPVRDFGERLRAASEWGYQVVFAVEDQPDIPEQPDLKVIRVPRDPQLAATVVWRALQTRCERWARRLGALFTSLLFILTMMLMWSSDRIIHSFEKEFPTVGNVVFGLALAVGLMACAHSVYRRVRSGARR